MEWAYTERLPCQNAFLIFKLFCYFSYKFIKQSRINGIVIGNGMKKNVHLNPELGFLGKDRLITTKNLCPFNHMIKIDFMIHKGLQGLY